MVRFDKEFAHTRAVFIDGYCQGEGYYRAIDLRSLRTTNKEPKQEGKLDSKLLVDHIWRPLHKYDALTPDQLIRVFAAFVEGGRTVYCPHGCARPSRSSVQRPGAMPCVYLTFGTGSTYNSLTKGWRRQRFADQLPVLECEYKNDPEADGGRYVQNLVLVPQTREYLCEEYDACIANWEKMTGFQQKAEEMYEDLPSFKNAWEAVTKFYARLHERSLHY